MTHQDPVKDKKAQALLQLTGDKLREFHKYQPSFSFDPRGTRVVAVFESAIAYARRGSDLFDGSQELWRSERFVPSLLLARAFLETVAMGTQFLSGLSTACEKGDQKACDEHLEKHYRGARHPQFGNDIPSLSVLTAIEKLAKLQETFLKTNSRAEDPMYRERAALAAELKKKGSSVVMDCYEKLSEFAHPNAAGSHGIYPLSRLRGEKLEPGLPLPGNKLRSQLLLVAGASRLQALMTGFLFVMELQKLEKLATAYHALVTKTATDGSRDPDGSNPGSESESPASAGNGTSQPE